MPSTIDIHLDELKAQSNRYKNTPIALCIIEPTSVNDLVNRSTSKAAIVARESTIAPTRIVQTWTVDGEFDPGSNRWELPVLNFVLTSSVNLQFYQLFYLRGANNKPPVSFTSSAINASTDEITLASHGRANGNEVVITADGTLPGAIAADAQPQIYKVVQATTNTFKLSKNGVDVVNFVAGALGSGTFWVKDATGDLCFIVNNKADDGVTPAIATIATGTSKTYQLELFNRQVLS